MVELMVVVVTVVFVVGILTERFVLRSFQGRGGWTVTIDEQTWHFTVTEIRQIMRLLSRADAASVTAVEHAGVFATDAQRVAAHDALLDAARRWLAAHPDQARQKLGLD